MATLADGSGLFWACLCVWAWQVVSWGDSSAQVGPPGVKDRGKSRNRSAETCLQAKAIQTTELRIRRGKTDSPLDERSNKAQGKGGGRASGESEFLTPSSYQIGAKWSAGHLQGLCVFHNNSKRKVHICPFDR